MNALETALPRNGSSRVNSAVHRPLRARLQNQVLTLENAERGITLHVGEIFLLNLGDRDWNVRVGDEAIVRADPALGIPSGSQGYYTALKAGKTKLYATSDPPCRQETPPCMQPTILLEIPVTVVL